MELTLQPPASPQVTGPGDGPRPVPVRLALPMAVLAGVALLLALPPYDLWWLAPAGVALLAAATHRRRLRAGFGLGLVTGLVLFVPLLEWTRLSGGWLPWLILATAQAAYPGLIGLACAWLTPLVDRWRALWPPLLGLLWVAQEAARDRAPFGGFPWGRVAFSQGDAPTLRLAAYGGAPLVTFAVGVAGGALLALCWRGRHSLPASWRRPSPPAAWRFSPAALGGRRVWLPALGYLAVLAAVTGGPLALPVGSGGDTTRRVAIIQGNVPRLGLDFNAQRRAVLDNHVTATRRLAAEVAAGRAAPPDLVVWPENSSDIDPLTNLDAAALISAAANEIRVPILVGAVLRTDKPADIKNAGLLWRPGAGPDLAQQYVKRHPVPFAEYMPMRPVARLVTDKVDLVRNMLAGDRPGVVDTGRLVLGDVICFEVAYDGIVRDTVTGGAQVLAVQTNNATFNEAEARQQLAMVRLRAVEHGRESLMISTVGVSGFVGTDGAVHQSSGFDVAAVMVREMRLGDSRTLATRLGHWPEMAAVALAVAALAGALPLRRRRTTSTDAEEKAEAR